MDNTEKNGAAGHFLRGAGIEIMIPSCLKTTGSSRLSHKERGLKLICEPTVQPPFKSPPAREARIEISFAAKVSRTTLSPPAREARIEI